MKNQLQLLKKLIKKLRTYGLIGKNRIISLNVSQFIVKIILLHFVNNKI